MCVFLKYKNANAYTDSLCSKRLRREDGRGEGRGERGEKRREKRKEKIIFYIKKHFDFDEYEKTDNKLCPRHYIE